MTDRRLGTCRLANESAGLDAGLRQVLAEMVLPEYVEIEFERVMKVVFSDVA
jgi:hypothetical protein